MISRLLDEESLKSRGEWSRKKMHVIAEWYKQVLWCLSSRSCRFKSADFRTMRNYSTFKCVTYILNRENKITSTQCESVFNMGSGIQKDSKS